MTKVLVLCTGNFSQQLLLLHKDLIFTHSFCWYLHIFTEVRIQTCIDEYFECCTAFSEESRVHAPTRFQLSSWLQLRRHKPCIKPNSISSLLPYDFSSHQHIINCFFPFGEWKDGWPHRRIYWWLWNIRYTGLSMASYKWMQRKTPGVKTAPQDWFCLS